MTVASVILSNTVGRHAEMIINIITFVFPILTYFVRLIRKNVRGQKTSTGSRLHHLPSDE